MYEFIKSLLGGQLAATQLRPRISIPEDRVSDIYAIGDVHGCLDLLLAAEQRIMQHVGSNMNPALVICVGDFIDRGPDSKGVIEHLMTRLPRPLYRICLCGNHDELFAEFLKTETFDTHWLFNLGGVETLFSYGIDTGRLLDLDPSGRMLMQTVSVAVPAAHADFLENLPVAVDIGRHVFVHAGVRPGVPLDKQADHDLMWIREPFLSLGPQADVTVIHGHTPGGRVQYGTNRVGIDTGAFMTGKLSVLHIGKAGMTEI